MWISASGGDGQFLHHRLMPPSYRGHLNYDATKMVTRDRCCTVTSCEQRDKSPSGHCWGCSPGTFSFLLTDSKSLEDRVLIDEIVRYLIFK